MKTMMITLATCGVLLNSCGQGTSNRGHSHGPDGHSHDEPGAKAELQDEGSIALTETARRNLGISFVRLDERQVSSTLRVPGAFELQPLARREYRMSLPGRVEILVDQYQWVEPGDVLFRFQSPKWPELLHEILTGEQAIASATAQIEVAEAKMLETRSRLEIVRERIAALAEADFKRADLQSDLQTLEAALPRQQAELRAAQAKLKNAHSTREHAVHVAATAAEMSETMLEQPVEMNGKTVPAYRSIDWIEVHARTAGLVDHFDVTDGAFVDSSDAVLSVVDPERVRFRALAMQSDMGQLTTVESAVIVPPHSPLFHSNTAVAASVTPGLNSHPQERTLELLATPEESADWIRPGVSAFLEIVTDENQPGEFALPDSSIVQDGLHHVVYLRERDHPDHVRAVQVEVGVSDGRWTVVRSSDEEFCLGAEVVHEGAYELKLASDAGESGLSAPTHVHADGTTH